jgi:hypothetical protein
MRIPYRDFTTLSRKIVVQKVEQDADGDTLVTGIEHQWSPTTLMNRFFNRDRGGWVETREVRYFGDCTVWYSAKSGTRLPTSMEAWLADIWNAARKNGDIPR